MKLVKRFTPPVALVAEVLVESDRSSQWYGYLFVKTKDGQVIHAADLKPTFEDVFGRKP